MIIKKEIFLKMLSCLPNNPPEIGGIIGGNNGEINEIIFDYGKSENKGCYYTPDIERLNFYINEWNSNGIEFYGIFHTHFFNVKTLSDGDKKYIEKIMIAMPEYINKLYFPVIVLPQKEVISYYAERKGESIEILQDKLTVN